MKQTPNYNLPQFEVGDKFNKETLNEGYSKIDLAISDLQETFNANATGSALTTQEVVEARKGKETLKDRIDGVEADVVLNKTQIGEVVEQMEQNMKQYSQIDYVDFVKNRVKYNNMSVEKIEENLYEVIMDNGNKGISYQFIKDPNDDFIKIHRGTLGSLDRQYKEKKDGTLNGSFNTGDVKTYTTTVGDTFTATFNSGASEISFMFPSDNRGGLWQFIVDGDESTKKIVSTYSKELITENEITIIDNLDIRKSHTVVATFKGADTSNPPSGGTARGWLLYWTSSPTKGTMRSWRSDYVSSTEILDPYSNKEFAFSVTCGDFSDFVPQHNTPSTYNIENPLFLINGVDVKLETGIKYPAESLELVQHCKINKNNTGSDIAELYFSTIVTKDGVINTSGKWIAKQPHEFNVAYPLMLPVDNAMNTIVTSYGNTKINSEDRSDYYFTEEKDKCTSIAMLNNRIGSVVASATIDNPIFTLRQKATTGKNLDTSLRYWQRDTPKLYFTMANELKVNAGDTFNWSGRLTIANIKNIYRYLIV